MDAAPFVAGGLKALMPTGGRTNSLPLFFSQPPTLVMRKKAPVACLLFSRKLLRLDVLLVLRQKAGGPCLVRGDDTNCGLESG